MATYNIQDEGAASDGSSAIDPQLDPLIADGNTIVFPPGDYLLNSLDVPSGTDNVTIQGQPGATLIPKDYGSNSTSPWVSVQGSGFEWHQFEIDVNGRNPGPVDINADDWQLTRLVTNGEVHAETDGEATGSSTVARSWFSLIVSSSDAYGLIEDCYFHNGSNSSVSQGSNRRAILVDQGLGHLTINRCWFEQWGENTIYAKHPVGKVDIFNSFWRNTQNGARTGGNTTVWNCVSIKDAPQPKNWASSAFMRGVAYEAEGTTTGDRNQYDGEHIVQECDFWHDFRSESGPDSCGAAVGGSSAPEIAKIIDCRIYYNTDREQNAIYNGRSEHGPPQRWAIARTHITNECAGSQYCVGVGETPEYWGDISGTWSADNGNYSDSNYVTSRMTIGDPDPVDTTPPLPQPPSGQPMANATLVTINNTGQSSDSYYSFEGAGETASPDAGTIHPSRRDDYPINMSWADGDAGRRVKFASGVVETNEIHRYYIAEGGLKEGSFTQSGDASITVDGSTVSTGPTAKRWTGSAWDPIDDGDITAESGLTLSRLRYREDGQWPVVVDK